ncbi:hypothetical protein JCM11641_005934 [Rhodosporidiobolus odoratus]
MPDSAELSPSALRALKNDFLTEHFRFAPESFTKGGMDLANRSLYAATSQVEQSLQKLVDQGVEGFEEEDVQRGIYALETLLEDGIDTAFDLYEIYVLRNTFSFPDDLLPYFALSHHATFDPSLRGTDDPTLQEYEEEVRLYEAELQKERELGAAEVFVMAKEMKVREQAELVGYLKQPGKLASNPTSPAPPDSRIPILTAQLTSLLNHSSTLSTTTSPSLTHPTSSSKPGQQPDETPEWANSRAAFINWAAAVKSVSSAAVASGTGGAQEGRRREDPTVGAMKRGLEEVGREGDAKALLNAMKAP